jgi:hypothetical protein
MPDAVVPTTQKQAMRMAIGLSTTLLIANAAFFFLSGLWFDDHKDADLTLIRLAFGALTFLVCAASFGAALAPRAIGHLIGLITGLTAFVGGIAALAQGMPYVMGVTLLVLGVVAPVLAYYSFQRSRAAWAVLIAILAVFTLVTFFGAPKVRGVLHIGLWSALIAPGLMLVAVIALSMVRAEYRERA